MKGKYFFVENGKEIEIQEFNYEYYRNSLLRNWDKLKNSNFKFYLNLVISKTVLSNGELEFDVRKLPLDEIYYSSRRLRIQKLIMDDIMFDRSLRVQDLPLPKLTREYNEWKEQQEAKAKMPLPAPAVNVPVYKSAERVEVDKTDARIPDIIQFSTAYTGLQNFDIQGNVLQVLDWIVNYDVCNRELAVQSQGISEKKITLSSAINDNSKYLESVFDKLRVTMEELFPLKPSLLKRMFGKNDGLEVKEKDMSKVLSTLQSAVKFDYTRFEGIKTLFDEINTDIETLQKNIDCGQTACQFQVSVLEDKFEWELGAARLEKVGVATDIMLASLISTRQEFMVNFNRMNEVQTILIPLVVDRLQSQVGSKIDAQTEKTIRALAYGASSSPAEEEEKANHITIDEEPSRGVAFRKQ